MAPSSSSHRADIQGLRAVAVLLVVLGHAGVGFLSGGFVGVDVFFVLSGFLITGLLLAEARSQGSISLIDFYVRRARRILPAAALTLLVTNIAAFYVLNFVRAQDAIEDSLYAGAFSANLHFAQSVDYFARDAPPSPVLHYWSLSVEEQFYLVWPLLLSILLFGVAVYRHRNSSGPREGRLVAVLLVLVLASLAYSIVTTATAPTAAYFSPLTRAWELGLGAVVAVSASTLGRIPASWRSLMGWAGVAAIAAAAVLFSEGTAFPGLPGLLPTVGAALVIAAGIGGMGSRLAVGRALAVRPMLIIGDRSYALYLWHWPVLILAAAYAGHELSVPANLGLAVGAFLLSCLSYAFVENPIRHRVRRRGTTALVVAVCMAALLGASATALAGTDRARQRFEGSTTAGASSVALKWGSPETSMANGALPSVIAAVRAARRGAPIPSGLTPPISELGPLPREYAPPNECIGHDVSPRIATKICRVGDPASKKVLVLMGDSHAMMWLPSIIEMARRDHWAVVPLLRLGCTPAKWKTGGGCQEWYEWAVRQVDRLDPRVTLIGGNISEKQTSFGRDGVEGIASAAEELRPYGAVVIGDPEGLDRNPVDCLLSRKASMATCMTTWPAQSYAMYDETARRVKQAGAAFLGTRGLVCFARQCPAVIARTIVWADTNHLSGAYAARIAPGFRAAFLRVTAKTRR